MIAINSLNLKQDFYRFAYGVGLFLSGLTNKGDVVVIAKRTSYEQIASFIGCMMHNRIPVIIQHPSFKVSYEEFSNKMSSIETAVGPSLCVCDAEDEPTFSRLWRTQSKIESLETIRNTFFCWPKSNETAFIQLSSGTTALPKIVDVSFSDVIDHCSEYGDFLELQEDDCIVSWLPLYHDMGMIACLMLPLIKETSFVHMDPFQWLARPKILFDAIEQYKGTHCWLPNFAFSFMADRVSGSWNLSSLKQIISCSEMTFKSDIDKFVAKFSDYGATESKIRVCYALAENVFAATQTRGYPRTVTTLEGDVLSCGEPMPSTEIKILQDNEVSLKSSHMPKSNLLGDNGFYSTSDVGFMDDGELFVKGRSDDMIISYGRNIFPYEVEKHIAEMDDIIKGRVACFGVYEESIGTQYVVICAESDNPDSSLDAAIRKSVNLEFGIDAKCKSVPKQWLIKTSSGKLSRNRTKDKWIESK